MEQVWMVPAEVAVMPAWVVLVLAAEEGDYNKDNSKGRDKGSSNDNNLRNSMDMDNNDMDSTGTDMRNNMDGVADGIAY